jgi:hypothetical protein
VDFGIIQAPFTETPFDCHPSFPVIPSHFTLAGTAGVEFLARFGRPLFVFSHSRPPFLANRIILRFWALRENNTGSGPDYPLRIAVEKLINASYSTISTAEPKPAAVLAVLDQRLHLTYDQCRPSTRMIEEEQVSKHMRLIYVAPQHGEFVYSGYPSEPFLAEAGAHALSAWREHYGRVAVETLAYGVEAVLSTQGDAGELVGRLVLMLAYDYAVESSMRPPPDSPPYPPHFSAGVCGNLFPFAHPE